MKENNAVANTETRLFGGLFLVTLSILLCGSMPSTSVVKTEPVKLNHRRESQFAIATVNDARQDQRSQLIRLAARYPQLFIQAGAGQLQTTGKKHR